MATYIYDTESQTYKGVFTVTQDNGRMIMFIIDGDPETTNEEHSLLYSDMQDLSNQEKFVNLLIADPDNAFLNYLNTR